MKTKELNVLVFFMIIAAGEILISYNQAKVQSSSDADSNKKEMKNTIEATQVINEENIDEENEVAYPELIDWSTCYTTLQEAEQKLANWISSHPNVGMHRDLPDDYLHVFRLIPVCGVSSPICIDSPKNLGCLPNNISRNSLIRAYPSLTWALIR